MSTRSLLSVAWPSCALLALCASNAGASDLDEFKIKRESVFEFARKPVLARSGDRTEISFAAKGFCDVTVAIEDGTGKIVRHLASGVLGPNAPAPFQKDALAQTLVWDGKDDRGQYLDKLEGVSVRVSLGLAPRFERTLDWEPKKRLGDLAYASSVNRLPTPLIRCAPEGIYVFDGCGVDHLRLFDHDGNYLRTVYPFSAETVGKVQGLTWHASPQDGVKTPLKVGFLQSTFLLSGATGQDIKYVAAMYGSAGHALAVQGNRIALAGRKLSRMAADGTGGGLSLHGPALAHRIAMTGVNRDVRGGVPLEVLPTSAAFSPNGQFLYLTGYLWRDGVPGRDFRKDCLHGVVRVEFEKDDPPALFAGSMKQGDSGKDDAHFCDALSVACDAQGRVYAADYGNDRVQVFAPEGKFLKSIATPKPARIQVDPRSGELYVFTWAIPNDMTWKPGTQVSPALTRFGPFDKPEKIASWPLPLRGTGPQKDTGDYFDWSGLQYQAELDLYAGNPTLWTSTFGQIELHELKDAKFVLKHSFEKDTAQSVAQTQPPAFWRQRLQVNPKTGLLYSVEGQTAYGKAFFRALEINPETGRNAIVELPFDAEDMAFDQDGCLYLRTNTIVARYTREAGGWREVPFDYGEEAEDVGISTSRGEGRRAAVISGIPLHRIYASRWHLGGLFVSLKGHVVVSCMIGKGDYAAKPDYRTDEKSLAGVRRYQPRFFPGRFHLEDVHVFDKHGNLLYEDALPGVFRTHGVAMDKDDRIYALSYDTRWLDGKPYFNAMSGTLLKFNPKEGRFICGGSPDSGNMHIPIPLPADSRPARAPDMYNGMTGSVWLEGALWKYGGVGFTGKNVGKGDGGCACWNSRFTLDYFGRSFAPEVDHYSVAILDSNGNLILRVGKYGNVDDGVPLDKTGGPAQPHALGGDEVGLFNACYVGTHTDRRLFIADAGNARILSVRLDYHATERVALSGVPRTVPAENK